MFMAGDSHRHKQDLRPGHHFTLQGHQNEKDTRLKEPWDPGLESKPLGQRNKRNLASFLGPQLYYMIFIRQVAGTARS